MNVFSEMAPAGKVRAAQKAATRARVLEVARAQLERDGYEATGIRSVARAAGVAAGTVLLHFRDKQDLLHAALADELERTWARARRTARGRSLEDDLLALARTFFDHYLRRPALSRALLKESLFAAPPWSARFAAQVAGVHAHVVTLVEAAKARGDVAASVDPPLLGAAFFSFYYFALISWVQGGLPDPVRLFRRMLAQHLDGLRAPKPKPRGRQR